MCGRIALFSPPSKMAQFLDAQLAEGVDPEGHPSWNIGPTQRIDGVFELDGARVLERFRWGLIPSWAKDASFGAKTFNARAETVATKPSFRAAYKSRRLLVPIDGFYEWDRHGDAKPQPNYFTRVDGSPMVLAGLFEYWRDPSEVEAPVLQSATVITTAAGDDMVGIHDRMPVVLEQGSFDLWLNAADDELPALEALLAATKPGTLTHHPVDRALGNVRNDGPHLIEEPPPSTLF
jgi:putative SOS response-associated peptidase YedK